MSVAGGAGLVAAAAHTGDLTGRFPFVTCEHLTQKTAKSAPLGVVSLVGKDSIVFA